MSEFFECYIVFYRFTTPLNAKSFTKFLGYSDVKILQVFGGGTIGGTKIKYVHSMVFSTYVIQIHHSKRFFLLSFKGQETCQQWQKIVTSSGMLEFFVILEDVEGYWSICRLFVQQQIICAITNYLCNGRLLDLILFLNKNLQYFWKVSGFLENLSII